MFIPVQNWPATGPAEPVAAPLGAELLDELHALTTSKSPATNTASRL
ncbi:MAG: hypothetical protein ACXWPJ_03255 [Candidatus Limnocylindrales bacterium]